MMKSIQTMIKATLPIIILLFFASDSSAQSLDPISLNYRSIPSQGQSSISNFDARLSLPIIAKPSGILLGGIAYSTRPDNIQGRRDIDLRLSTFSFNLSYLRPISPSTRMLISLNTGMYSDFKDISSEDFNTSALALFFKSGKNGFSYSYGFAYIRNFYGNAVLPFFGFSKRVSPSITFNLMNPLTPSITYAYSSTVTYGIEGMIRSQDYRLTDDFQSLVYVDRSFSTAPFVDLKMNNFSSFSFKLGYNFLQNVKVYKDIHNASAKWYTFSNDEEPLYSSKTTGVFFEAGIKLNFPTKTK